MTSEPKELAGAATQTCDVLIIGGGPGGAATAVFLKQAGLDVVLLEKDHHPRFHIGESLLPKSMPLLESIGVLDKVRALGVRKSGAEFISPCGEKNVYFDFSRAMRPEPDHAFQVPRADFDKLIFDRAREVGVRCHEDTTVSVLTCDDDMALVQSDGPESSEVYQAAFLVDASGRSTLTAKMYAEKSPDPRNTSAAIFGHFHNVPRDPDQTGGRIRIHLTEPGWMWQIPLPNGVTSIGLVAPGEHMAKRETGIEDYFRQHCARHPDIDSKVRDASLAGPMRATGNFSYRAARAFGPGHIKVGDAYGFIDPVFSTGVHLALSSASEASAAILKARANPARRTRIMEAYDRHIQARLKYVSWFIYNIHDAAFREMVLHPRNILGIEHAVISLLAGDFSNTFSIRWRIALFKMFHRVVGWDLKRKGMKHAGRGELGFG